MGVISYRSDAREVPSGESSEPPVEQLLDAPKLLADIESVLSPLRMTFHCRCSGLARLQSTLSCLSRIVLSL